MGTSALETMTLLFYYIPSTCVFRDTLMPSQLVNFLVNSNFSLRGTFLSHFLPHKLTCDYCATRLDAILKTDENFEQDFSFLNRILDKRGQVLY